MHKLKTLKSILSKYPGVVVAFSGGVDSSFLLKIAKDVLGDRVIAATVVSPLMPKSDLMNAAKIARHLGVEHISIPLNTLSIRQIRGNSRNRCYHCKRLIMRKLKEIADKHKYTVIEGTSRSDLEHYRPGTKALKQLGIVSPLRQAGFEKRLIRRTARRLGLHNWNAPSAACLASRIPYGEEITEKKLQRVEKAERYLRLRFTHVRVRDHYPIARIEISSSELGKGIRERARIVRYLEDLGYMFVTLDLAGYRTGSFDR